MPFKKSQCETLGTKEPYSPRSQSERRALVLTSLITWTDLRRVFYPGLQDAQAHSRQELGEVSVCVTLSLGRTVLSFGPLRQRFQPFGTRDRFRGRQFFHGPSIGEEREVKNINGSNGEQQMKLLSECLFTHLSCTAQFLTGHLSYTSHGSLFGEPYSKESL